jgi:hypothetical protein
VVTPHHAVGTSEAAPSSTSPLPTHACVRCEILPVACTNGGIVHLWRRTTTGQSLPTWWVELPPGLHPTQAVVHALAENLEGLFDPSTSVVHSTSWRYEPCHVALVLSFVVILQPPEGLTSPPPGFTAEPVELGHAHCGAEQDDPFAIRVADVLAHGLHHFALLRFTDPAIASALSADWHNVLARWHPLPAGLHDHYNGERDSRVLHPPPHPATPTAATNQHPLD